MRSYIDDDRIEPICDVLMLYSHNLKIVVSFGRQKAIRDL